jgi:hypothetical protein
MAPLKAMAVVEQMGMTTTKTKLIVVMVEGIVVFFAMMSPSIMRLLLLAEAVAADRAVEELEMSEAPVEGMLVNQARALIKTILQLISIGLVAEEAPNGGAGLLQHM